MWTAFTEVLNGDEKETRIKKSTKVELMKINGPQVEKFKENEKYQNILLDLIKRDGKRPMSECRLVNCNPSLFDTVL